MSFPTLIPFNATTPAGRAAMHLFGLSPLTNRDGIEVKPVNARDASDGGRTLIIHPSVEPLLSDGERAVVTAIASLVSSQHVCLSWLLDDMDTNARRAFAEAVLIAGGFTGHTLVQVSA